MHRVSKTLLNCHAKKKLPPILYQYNAFVSVSYKMETTVLHVPKKSESICTYFYYNLLLKGSLKGD